MLSQPPDGELAERNPCEERNDRRRARCGAGVDQLGPVEHHPGVTPRQSGQLERDDLTTLLVETDTMKRLERIIPSLERQATVLAFERLFLLAGVAFLFVLPLGIFLKAPRGAGRSKPDLH